MNKIIILFFLSFYACGNKHKNNIKSYEMTFLEFKNSTIEKLNTKDTSFENDNNKSLEMIKIFNTINYYNLNDSLSDKYNSVFLKFYIQKIVKHLGCKVSIGM